MNKSEIRNYRGIMVRSTISLQRNCDMYKWGAEKHLLRASLSSHVMLSLNIHCQQQEKQPKVRYDHFRPLSYSIPAAIFASH